MDKETEVKNEANESQAPKSEAPKKKRAPIKKKPTKQEQVDSIFKSIIKSKKDSKLRQDFAFGDPVYKLTLEDKTKNIDPEIGRLMTLSGRMEKVKWQNDIRQGKNRGFVIWKFDWVKYENSL